MCVCVFVLRLCWSVFCNSDTGRQVKTVNCALLFLLTGFVTRTFRTGKMVLTTTSVRGGGRLRVQLRLFYWRKLLEICLGSAAVNFVKVSLSLVEAFRNRGDPI